MIIDLIMFILGFILVVEGADLLVDGSSSLAKRLGVPPLIIGLTVVAFGTSLPELVVNIFSALKGSTDLALGNVIGSNLANILLILGSTALFVPIAVKGSTVWKEIPFSFLAAIVLLVVANDTILNGHSVSTISRADGIVMLLFFLIFFYYAFELARTKREEIREGAAIPLRKAEVIFLMLVGGIIGLYFGGRWIVDGALNLTKQLGLSEFVISTTIIALGTSLPELVTSITAAMKHKPDLAVGNIVGSNIFNIFLILGITSTIKDIALPPWANIDILAVLAVTFLLFLFIFISKERKISRWHGAILFLLYIAYIAYSMIRG